jgi:2-keto-3-deoxy-L-rhamnonate aldolase RhmA
MAEFKFNPAKRKLEAGGVVTLVMGDYTPDMCEFLGSLGFDAVMGEMEHFTTSWQDIANMSTPPRRRGPSLRPPSTARTASAGSSADGARLASPLTTTGRPTRT